MTPRFGKTFLALALVAMAAVGTRPAVASGLLIAEGPLGGVLDIKEQNVHVTINNGVAVTEIDQVFINTEDRVVEALYTFPVPKAASVSNFSMWIGGKEMIGEVVEKKRAREIYESYKQVRRDPGLLEQVDYKRFEMRVFPIPARAEQRVKLTYYQELDMDHDWATYVYPLATVSKPGLVQKTKGRFAVTVDVKSEVPIAEMTSPSHGGDLAVAKHNAEYWRASLENNAAALDRDVVLAFHVERPKTGFDVITSRTGNRPGFFQLSLTAGKELEELNRGMDYVFVLDVSGSMANDGKLMMSRTNLSRFIDALGPEDRFEVIAFNIAPQTLFNETRVANSDNLQQAVSFLNSQRARGGTVLKPALDTAYRYANADRTLNVVILSDGMTEQNEQAELLRLIKSRPAGSRVFCIGVGNDVNRPLLSQLASEAGGLAAFLSQGDDFDRQAQAFRRKLMRPAVSNLKLSFSGGAIEELEPALLPNLYHGAPLRIYGRYAESGPVKLTVKGEVQGQPFEQSVEVKLPKADDSNPEIERMWAWKRVDRLMGEIRQGGDPKPLVDEVIALCEDFSIAGEYASFIVLENDAEYQRWKIERRNATRLERDRRAQASLQAELEKARNQSLVNLGPGNSATPSAAAAPASSALPGTADPTLAQSDPAPFVPTQQSPVPSQPNRGFDLDLPGTSGGGAIDPISAAIGLGLAGAAAAGAARRKRKSAAEESAS